MSMTIIAFRTSDTRRTAEARHIREQVFCREQGVPPSMEWDGGDDIATHYLAYLDTEAVGTARLRPKGAGVLKVERMAVLMSSRGQGVGRALLRQILANIVGDPSTRGTAVVLHAQTAVSVFYEKLGFVAEGAGFMEAGIPHIAMRWTGAR